MNKYIKPGISFQSLTLSSSVTASCAEIANLAEGKCIQTVPGWDPVETIFIIEAGCYYDQKEMGGYVCYHAPTSNKNIFSS